MKNKIFAFVLMLFCVASCHPKAIVISPVAPRAAVVAEATTNTARIATKVKQEIKTVNADIKSLQIDTEKGKFLAAQMKKSGTATLEQIEENYKNWDAINFKVKFFNSRRRRSSISAIAVTRFPAPCSPLGLAALASVAPRSPRSCTSSF